MVKGFSWFSTTKDDPGGDVFVHCEIEEGNSLYMKTKYRSPYRILLTEE